MPQTDIGVWLYFAAPTVSLEMTLACRGPLFMRSVSIGPTPDGSSMPLRCSGGATEDYHILFGTLPAYSCSNCVICSRQSMVLLIRRPDTVLPFIGHKLVSSAHTEASREENR